MIKIKITAALNNMTPREFRNKIEEAIFDKLSQLEVFDATVSCSLVTSADAEFQPSLVDYKPSASEITEALIALAH